MTKTPRKWTLRAACENFENIFDMASTDDPKTITNGKESVIVLRADDYQRLSARAKKQSLVEFFAQSPLVNSGIDLSRSEER
jgi:hypothetical protein